MLLQQLVGRDAAKLIYGLERLEVVIGCDHAENLIHVMMRLIDYLPLRRVIGCVRKPQLLSHYLAIT